MSFGQLHSLRVEMKQSQERAAGAARMAQSLLRSLLDSDATHQEMQRRIELTISYIEQVREEVGT